MVFGTVSMLMDEGQRTRRTPRRDVEYPNNLQVVKERRYAELEEAIAAEKTRRAAEREAAVEVARVAGLLEECQCCYSTDCLKEDMIQSLTAGPSLVYHCWGIKTSQNCKRKKDARVVEGIA